MTNNQLTDLRTLILSEVGDFFAGVGSPGEPETPKKMQRELSMRLGRILNNHIVNYPRCEALVEILRECRIARDEAQAELQERRKAEKDSEPVGYFGRFDPDDEDLIDQCSKNVKGAFPLYRHAQPAPVVPPMQHWEELCREHPDMSIGDAIIRAAWWNHCRAAMLQSGNSPVIPEGYVMVPEKAMTPKMIIAVQMNTELGSYAAANLVSAYRLFDEFWSEACRAAQQEVKGE